MPALLSLGFPLTFVSLASNFVTTRDPSAYSNAEQEHLLLTGECLSIFPIDASETGGSNSIFSEPMTRKQYKLLSVSFDISAALDEI